MGWVGGLACGGFEPKPAVTLSWLAVITVGCASCGKPGLREQILGSWVTTNGVLRFDLDGACSSYFSNRAGIWAFDGKWELKAKVVVLTTSKSNGVPCLDRTRLAIVRADGHELVYMIGGQTFFYTRQAPAARARDRFLEPNHGTKKH